MDHRQLLDSEIGLKIDSVQSPISRDYLIRRFFASLKFENREKLDQLGLEPGYFELNKGN